jgi:hypothetical protein
VNHRLVFLMGPILPNKGLRASIPSGRGALKFLAACA